MKTLLTLLVAMFLVSCGTAPDATTSSSVDGKDGKDGKNASEPASGSTDLASGSYLSVEGYVSPIDISVDGKSYKDSEDFYTQELRRLQAQARQQYSGYTLTFDAQIGLRNFKVGMYVFLVATADVGVASEAYVDGTGKFAFMVDGKADRNIDYTMRATKRINMQLTKKGEPTISWCYNMFAQKNVMLNGKPNILRTFVTSVTEYQCEQTDGIQLPDAPDYPTEDQAMDEEWSKASKAEAERDAENNKN